MSICSALRHSLCRAFTRAQTSLLPLHTLHPGVSAFSLGASREHWHVHNGKKEEENIYFADKARAGLISDSNHNQITVGGVGRGGGVFVEELGDWAVRLSTQIRCRCHQPSFVCRDSQTWDRGHTAIKNIECIPNLARLQAMSLRQERQKGNLCLPQKSET